MLEICPTSNLLTKALRRRGRSPGDVPRVRRPRRALHDRDRRAGDDADAPARRVRPPAPDRRARRGRAARGERPRARRELHPGDRPPVCVLAAPPGAALGHEIRLSDTGSSASPALASPHVTRHGTPVHHRPSASGDRAHRGGLLERGGRRAPRHLPQNRQGPLRRPAPETRRLAPQADPRRVPEADGPRPPRPEPGPGPCPARRVTPPAPALRGGRRTRPGRCSCRERAFQ